MTGRSKPAWPLGIRLAVIFAITLLPLGVIASLQSDALLNESRARSEAALMGAIRAAAAEELRAVQQAQGAAAALSHIAPVIEGDIDACIVAMSALVEQSDLFSFAGLYRADGYMECSSAGRPFTFEPSPAREEAIREARPSVHVNRNAPLSSASVLFAQHPVFDENGSVVAFTAVSVPHSTLSMGRPDEAALLPILLVTFNERGELISSSVGMDEAQPRLPRDRPLASLASGPSVTFTGHANNGNERVFSVVPLVPGTLYALGSWSADALPGALSWSSLPSWLVPVLMWAVSLVVALAAAERLVVRHIKALTQSIVRFARGDRLMTEMDSRQAPAEIREACEAFDQMRHAILQDEAELEDTVHQKEVLLREVHHRVKNNLQLIASIMNLKARRAVSPEAKDLLRRLNDRVMSLATIHKSLYQTSGVADVSADELLSDILRQMLRMATGPENRVTADTQFDAIRLTPDQAVPLALLTTEAVTNALKHSDAAPFERPRLSVTLRRVEPGMAEFTVANSANGASLADADRGKDIGLGSQLMDSFVHQLEGTAERRAESDAYTLVVRFPIGALHQAEEGAAPRAVPDGWAQEPR
jgi:two-component sensor histidine kinase